MPINNRTVLHCSPRGVDRPTMKRPITSQITSCVKWIVVSGPGLM